MANTISPNMSLIIPGVGSEQGPTYAFDVNNSLNLIDQHDHSTGKGVQITPAGININDTLNFNGNLATNIAGLLLNNEASANTTLGSISVAPGSGTGIGDLYFTDYAGNTIQMTKSGAINVVASSIPGESYNSGTFIWTQTQSSLPTTPANFDIGSITLRPNVAATTFGTTLVPPSTGNFTINLPVPVTEGLAGVPNFVTMDQSGQQADTYFLDNVTLNTSGNAVQVKPGGIGLTQLNSSVAPAFLAAATTWNSQIFTSSGTFTVPAGVNQLFIVGTGGGGGGGSGGAISDNINSSTASGGTGGQGVVPQLVTLSVTPASMLTISVGGGGAGGAGVTSTNQVNAPTGHAGNPGATSAVAGAGIALVFSGGLGGGGGTAAPGSATTNAPPNPGSYSPTGSSTSGGTGATAVDSVLPSQAGSGGINTYLDTIALGGTGSVLLSGGHFSTASGGGGGGAGLGAGGTGGNGSDNATPAPSGGNGTSGGGGGGGGGVANVAQGAGGTVTSGAGGTGGSGNIAIYWLGNA